MRSKTKWLACYLLLTAYACPVWAATPVTVAQIRSFLTSSASKKERDAAIAERLGSITLSEQLTHDALAQILTETALGPMTREQLRLLAAASVLRNPPRTDQATDPIPDAAQQKEWIAAVEHFADGYLQHLPDFLATRFTQSYDNSPQTSEQKHSRPRIAFHWVGESRREIAYRNGVENEDEGRKETEPARTRSLNSWSEFGAVLRTALSDAFAGSVQFSRWDAQTLGAPVAVLHFDVPLAASHYLVDFCCYQTDENSGWMKFEDTPGYHGDIYLDPNSRQIVRLRLEADLKADDAVSTSGMVVDYGQVQIGGHAYICPIKSVAVLIAHNLAAKAGDGDGLTTYLNETGFQDYRKFGSTTRILPTP